MRGRVEALEGFGRVRYAQCWEDADVLLDGLRVPEGGKCLSICSAGDNTLALLTRNPSRVVAIDLSEAQLHCLELRVAAYRSLEHRETLELLGSAPSGRRRELFDACRGSLSERARRHWEARLGDVERLGAGGIGKFEGYMRAFRRVVLPLVCRRQVAQELFTPRPPAARREFYRRHWDSPRWRLLLRIACSRTLVGRFARDPAFFRHVTGSLPRHIGRRVAHAMQTLDPSANPYLHWVLHGTHSGVRPLALREEHYGTIRDNLGRLEWRRQSLEEFAASGETVDAFNLSNVFEYMSEDEFARTYERLIGCARSGARLLYWNMMVPRSVPPSLAARVLPMADLGEELHARDKAFFYSRVVVEEVR